MFSHRGILALRIAVALWALLDFYRAPQPPTTAHAHRTPPPPSFFIVVLRLARPDDARALSDTRRPFPHMNQQRQLRDAAIALRTKQAQHELRETRDLRTRSILFCNHYLLHHRSRRSNYKLANAISSGEAVICNQGREVGLLHFRGPSLQCCRLCSTARDDCAEIIELQPQRLFPNRRKRFNFDFSLRSHPETKRS